TAFPPAPPTPMTVILGFRSCGAWGMLILMVIVASHSQGWCRFGLAATSPAWFRPTISKVLPDPFAHPAEPAGRPVASSQRPRRPLFPFPHRIGEQPGAGGESGAAGGLRQSLDAHRPAHADLLFENERSQ